MGAGPTWEPDWSVAQRLLPRWVLSTALASGMSISEAEIQPTQKPALLVQGVECGTVSSVGDKAPDEDEDPENLEEVIRSWATDCTEQKQYASGKETQFDASVKTVFWNILRERCPFDSGLLSRSEAEEAIQKTLRLAHRPGERARGRDQGKGEQQLRYSEALGKYYIELDNGYIGMTSAPVEDSDVVCVILGCPLPMILRPHSSGRYRVIGPAYIYGLMDGEGVLGPLPDNYIVQAGASSYGWYGAYTVRNEITGKEEEDPRLGGSPPSWVRIKAIQTPVDPLHFVRFRKMDTGKTINGDPRLLPEGLRARGIALRPLKLV
jgi:hypothetical protein